jgi:hypothetical protein
LAIGVLTNWRNKRAILVWVPWIFPAGVRVFRIQNSGAGVKAGRRCHVGEQVMKKTAILAIGLTTLAVTACAPRYYDRPYSYGYADRDRDGVPNRYDRDRDNDGVPNYADRRPGNPYRD